MTKRYVKLKKKIDEIENSDPEEYLNLIKTHLGN